MNNHFEILLLREVEQTDIAVVMGQVDFFEYAIGDFPDHVKDRLRVIQDMQVYLGKGFKSILH